MNRPPLEVADIIRSQRESFLEQSRSWIGWQHRKVLDAIERCRTAALGAHRDRCSDCGHVAISYNSCVMGSNSLWRVGRRKGMQQTVSHPFDSPLRFSL
jgi:Transposase zinc-binding domain